MQSDSSTWDFTTLPALIAQTAEVYGDLVAIEDGDTTLTYVEFDAMRRRVARALIAQGIAKGDRVMIWAPNGWKWLASCRWAA
jgi:non-ribosomal peptide synthetase component E (peptide arylation enzyme)